MLLPVHCIAHGNRISIDSPIVFSYILCFCSINARSTRRDTNVWLWIGILCLKSIESKSMDHALHFRSHPPMHTFQMASAVQWSRDHGNKNMLRNDRKNSQIKTQPRNARANKRNWCWKWITNSYRQQQRPLQLQIQQHRIDKKSRNENQSSICEFIQRIHSFTYKSYTSGFDWNRIRGLKNAATYRQRIFYNKTVRWIFYPFFCSSSFWYFDCIVLAISSPSVRSTRTHSLVYVVHSNVRNSWCTFAYIKYYLVRCMVWFAIWKVHASTTTTDTNAFLYVRNLGSSENFLALHLPNDETMARNASNFKLKIP